MNNKLSPFQIIMFTALIIIILIAVAMFALRTAKNNSQGAPVSMWGVVDENIIKQLQTEINNENKNALNVVYTQIKPENFESEMVEALAAGNAPDIFLLPDNLLLKQQNKLFKIPYSNYPQRDFKNNFIEGSEILLTKDGVWGLPFAVDP
jgi:ABC-type glycerol-3-phosphate transport system substrate-binding protein